MLRLRLLPLTCSAAFSFLLLALLLLKMNSAHAESSIHYVSSDGNCVNAQPCYAIIQSAVDAAQAGDEIRIAGGIYTGVNQYAGLSQLVYLTKSLTLRGGYSVNDWSQSAPQLYTTTLDAEQAGRVFYISGPVSVTIEGLAAVNGDASGLGGGPQFSSLDPGGGLYAISSTVTISDTVWKAHKSSAGGAIYFPNGQCRLQNSIVISNYAESHGGGLYIGNFATESSIYINNSRFESNSAEYGGAISISNSNLQIEDTHIILNKAFQGGGINAHYITNGYLVGNIITGNIGTTGGGMSLSGNMLVSRNIVASNRGNWGSGIALFFGQTSLIQNQIINNKQTDRQNGIGGGLTISGQNYDDGGLKVIVSNLISGNEAWRGGGIFLQYARITSSQNMIIHNTAQEGGGLFVSATKINMNGDSIVKNYAHIQGGGITLYGHKPESSLHNLLLIGNHALQNGSAVAVEYNPASIHNATIVNNPGTSAIFVQAGISITNTILVSHTVAISATADSFVTGNGILWHGNGANTAGPGTFQLSNQINGDPAFIDDTYRIGPTSPARDAGVVTDVFNDIDGQPRPYLAPDLGADEYWSEGLPLQLFAPLLQRQ